MFLGFVKDMKFVPSTYVNTVFDIDYNKLYERGIRLILTDLDNTLISYKENNADDKLLEWIKQRKNEGFEVIIVSNNSNKERVTSFAKELEINSVSVAMKPLKRGIKKALKLASRKYDCNEVVSIGDQLMTDVFSANRMKFNSVLVKAIDRKTEKWTTRFNRKLELHVIKKISKKYPELYEERIKIYYEDNYGRN
jgi:HAD superfamily phosphatase (TIGR01668 family)